MIAIEATLPLVEAPAWAVLERQLIKTMEDAVHPFLEKYTHPDGRLIWRDGLRHSRDGADDFYESFYNWPLLYLLGGGDQLLALGQRQWEATTELMVEYGHVYKEYEIGYDQFHQSESYIYFYLLCMADPTHAENGARARRFAGFYLNEDPEALNYDPEHKIIKCAHNGSKGPRWLYAEDEEPSYGYSPGMACYGLPYEDLEGIDEPADLKDPAKARRMGQAMKERMTRGDCATNLHVTSLIANAFYLTGDDKYRAWLLEYVDAWIERAAANGGLLPDNVGLSGQVGEYMDGRWYGSMYGWTWPHGLYNIAMAAILAGTHCYLLTGEEKYLELPRTQLRKVLGAGEDGRFGPNRDELGRTLDRPANRARRRQGQLCGALLLRGQGVVGLPAAGGHVSGCAVEREWGRGRLGDARRPPRQGALRLAHGRSIPQQRGRVPRAAVVLLSQGRKSRLSGADSSGRSVAGLSADGAYPPR